MQVHVASVEEQAWVLGRIKARALPADLTLEDFLAWWPRLTEKERDRYTVEETKNVITVNGRTNILTYIGNTALSGGIGGTVVPWAMFFAVGTGATASVSAGDTGMYTEFYRAAPSTATISGNSVNISTFFAAGNGNATYTNAGLWGNNATSSANSGTLMTHALYTYTKTNANSLTNDYIINLN